MSTDAISATVVSNSLGAVVETDTAEATIETNEISAEVM
jgi:hypothetical protein